MSKRFLVFFVLVLTAVCATIALSDVTIPSGTKSTQSNENYNRNSIYLPRYVYYGDGGSHTIRVGAPASLTSDSYSFLFPNGNGTANQCLATDGSGGTFYQNVIRPSLGEIVNADVSASADIQYSKLDLSSSITTGDLDSGFILPASKGGTGITSLGSGVATWLGTPSSANLLAALTTSTGSGSAVFSTSPVLVTPNLGTPSAIDLTNATNVPPGAIIGTVAIAQGGTGASTKSSAFDALSPMSAVGDVIYGGSSGTGTALTKGTTSQLLHSGNTPSWSAVSLTADVSGTLPVLNGGTGITSFGTGIASWLSNPSSLNLLAAMTTSTGTGHLVFATAPTITLGNATGLPLTTGVTGTLPIANGGTGQTSASSAFDALSPMSAAGDVIYGGTSGAGTALVKGTSVQLLHSGNTPSWSAVSLTADVTGTLPLANGGTNATSKAGAFDSLSPMSAAGDIVYGGASGTGTALTKGTSVQVLHSGTTPSWSGVSLTADVTGTLPEGNGGTGITSLGSGVATWLGTPSSANLLAALTTSTGSGSAVFGTTPTLATPLITTYEKLSAGAETRWYNAGDTHYVGFKAPALSADQIWTLPTADGLTNQALITNGSGALSWATASTNPTTTAGDILYSTNTATPGTLGRLGIGSATTVLHGGASAPAYSAVSLTADVTGVLPLANGGTNKNMTAAAGGIVWTDSDSLEVTGAGSASNWVLSGGSATPTMSNTTTTGKFVDGSADEIQMRVQGHSTQTSNIFTAEKSDATILMAVTNTAGTIVKGTTTNTNLASGHTGEIGELFEAAATSTGWTSSNATVDVTNASLSLTAGIWEVWGSVVLNCTSTGTNTYAQAMVTCSGTGVGGATAAGEGVGTIGVQNNFCSILAPSIQTGLRYVTISNGNTGTCKLQFKLDFGSASNGAATIASFIKARRVY